MRIADIRQSDIQLLINANSNHPRTCQQIKLTLEQIFNLAVDEDLIEKSPCRRIELPRHLKKEQEDRLSLQHTIAELTKSIADAGETIEAQKAKLVELFNRTGDAAKMRDLSLIVREAIGNAIKHGAAKKVGQFFRFQRLQNENFTTGKQSSVDFERGVFRRGADQDDASFFHKG